MTAPPVFEVFAIRYAHRAARRPDNFIGGDPHDAPMPMDYFIWLVRNGSRTVLVDTGFDTDMAVKRHRTLLRAPRDALRLFGVEPADVREIVITHLHNDHVGTFSDFPNATFHLQDDEIRIKFDTLAMPVIGTQRAQRIADLVEDIEKSNDVGEFMRMTAKPKTASSKRKAAPAKKAKSRARSAK